MTAQSPPPRGIDPPTDEMRALGYRVVDWLVDQWDQLAESPVANLEPLDVLIERIGEELPVGAMPLEASIGFLDERVLPHMTRVNHPRFHAYIPGPGSFYGAIGDFIASALNPFLGSSLGGASFAALELVTLRWVAEAVGYPSDTVGIFTSGGSMANLGALAAARATQEDWTEATIYLSDQVHASVEKAAHILGFRSEQLVRVPTGPDFALEPDSVRDAVRADRAHGRRPLALCANAGATNTGAVDPLEALADVCASENLWFHVDAAYGGFAALTARGRVLLRGMDRADSLTLDPHKWFYSPMGCGCLLVRRPGALERAFATSGEYLQDVAPTEVNFFDRGPELSRRARALPVWLLTRTVGIEALRDAIDADLDQAALAEALLGETEEFEVVSRNLSIVTFRLRAQPGEDEADRSQRERTLVSRLLAGGDVLVSSTVLGDCSALRLVVANHRTDEAQLRRSVTSLQAAARAVRAQAPDGGGQR